MNLKPVLAEKNHKCQAFEIRSTTIEYEGDNAVVTTECRCIVCGQLKPRSEGWIRV